MFSTAFGIILLLFISIYLAEKITTTPYSVTNTDYTIIPNDKVTTESKYGEYSGFFSSGVGTFLLVLSVFAVYCVSCVCLK